MAAVLRSPAHRLLSGSLLLLTVTGRRSGRRHTLPVGYARDGDLVYVLVGRYRAKRWWRNLIEPAPVRVRLRGEEIAGSAQAFPPGRDADIVAEATEAGLRAPSAEDAVVRILLRPV
ncbi:MAG: nitroreductase/quinone reductase family protein [Syntrophothermus sp.]